MDGLPDGETLGKELGLTEGPDVGEALGLAEEGAMPWT
jgi:hypothetical protein